MSGQDANPSDAPGDRRKDANLPAARAPVEGALEPARAVPVLPLRDEDAEEPDLRGVRGIRNIGIAAAILFFVGVLGLFGFAPLDAAAIAPGTIVSEGSRRTIDHLEGGIVAEILVRDGDAVSAGQVLVRMDETRAKAQADMLDLRRVALLASRARLLAERDGAAAVAFPEALRARAGAAVIAEAITGQERLFATRRQAVEGRRAMLRVQIEQAHEQIGGLERRIASLKRQESLIADELVGVRALFAKGLERAPRVRALERTQASLSGERGVSETEIARTRQVIAETQLKVADLDNAQRAEVTAELRKVEEELAAVGEQLMAAQDVLARTEVRAPVAGTVVNRQVHTIGASVRPNATLLEIVADEDRLVIEAQARPSDIDDLHTGMTARITLSAYSMRQVPPLEGRLIHVSADAQTDPRTGRSWYVIRAEADSSALQRLEHEVALVPGMPAEVVVPTRARSGFDYLLSPIESALHRSFREP